MFFLQMYWVALRLVGIVFVCLLLLLASLPSQPADVPTAKAGLVTHEIFSKKPQRNPVNDESI